MFYTHLFINTVPLLFALLPLSTNTYGNPGGLSENSWCFITTSTDDNPDETASASYNLSRNRESDDQINLEIAWDFLSFYGWIIACAIGSGAFLASTLATLRIQNHRNASSLQQVWGLLLYPAIMLTSSTYSMVTDLRVSAGDLVADGTGPVVILLLHGFFVSLAFFYVNGSARALWYALFLKVFFHVEAPRGVSFRRSSSSLSLSSLSSSSRKVFSPSFLSSTRSRESLSHMNKSDGNWTSSEKDGKMPISAAAAGSGADDAGVGGGGVGGGGVGGGGEESRKTEAASSSLSSPSAGTSIRKDSRRNSLSTLFGVSETESESESEREHEIEDGHGGVERSEKNWTSSPIFNLSFRSSRFPPTPTSAVTSHDTNPSPTPTPTPTNIPIPIPIPNPPSVQTEKL